MTKLRLPRRPARGRPEAPTPARNVLGYRPVAAVARSRWFPGVFQWVCASVFLVIVWQLLLGPSTI